MHDELMTHATTGAVAAYAIEVLKRVGWCPWLTADTTKLNRVVSAVIAALIAFGITATGDAETGWTIHIPMLSVLINGIWEWAKQWVVQQLCYDAAIKPRK